MRPFKKDFPACVVSSLIAALVVLAYLIAPAPLGLAQRSTPTPIVDKERAGGPERVQLETGKYKLVYRNKAGQIIEEEVYEYAGSMLNIWRQIQETKVLQAYPDGRPAQAKSVTFDSERKFATGETNSAFPSKEEEIKYDRDGKPFEVITYTADEDGKINRFHREVTTFPTGSGPKGVTVDQDYIQATGTWRDSTFQPKRPDEKRPSSTKTSSTSLPGYTIKNDNSVAGLSVVNLSTPDGRIYLNIPSAMSAGATISGTVVEEPEGKTQKEQEEHRATLDKLTLRIGDLPVPINNGIFRITIPAKYDNEEPPALHCGFGNQSVATVPVNVSDKPPHLTQFTIPTGGQDGRPLIFKGPFDGIVSDGDYLSVGNQQMPFMAESSDGLRIVRLADPGDQNAAPVYGQTTIKLNESGQAFECPFRRLGLALSSNRPLNLLRGETATVFVKVLGLAGLNQDVPLDLVNTTPNIINLQGGEEQHRVIHTGDVQGDGTYLMERNVTGVQRGAFNITATVTWKETCERGANAQ